MTTSRPAPEPPSPSYNSAWSQYLASQRRDKITAQFLTILHHTYSDGEFSFLANAVDYGMLEKS